MRKALSEFGAPIGDLSESDLSVEGTIVQIGIAPNRIDILTSIEALAFDACYARACETSYGGVSIRALSKDDLITNKRAVGRKQDLLDVENLEKV